MLSARSIVSLAAFSISLTGCGSSEFTCDETRTCPSANEPDGASGSGGSAGTAGSSGSAGDGGSSGSGASAGSAGSAGDSSSGGTGGSAGEDGAAGSAGTGDAGPDGDSGACTVGTEGCACTAARGCSSGLVCKGAICAKPVCGDSRVEGNEFCDDGRNLGTAVGDCAPDCSVTVVQKKIVLSAATVLPDFGKEGPGPVVENVDRNCPSGYKALFADGLHRIATITPNLGDGQKGWVLRPWTRYVNEAGAPIWLTNESALLGVVNRRFQGLTNALIEQHLVITGMQADWTLLPTGHNCANWTSLTADLEIGWSWRPADNFLQGNDLVLYPCNPPGGSTYKVYCVEQ